MAQAEVDIVAREQRLAVSPPNNIALELDAAGVICDCDAGGEAVLQHHRSALLGKHISVLLPRLKEPHLLGNGEPTPRLRFLSHIGQQFEIVTGDGQKRLASLFWNRLTGPGPKRFRLIVRQG